jgi:hypothetical protein
VLLTYDWSQPRWQGGPREFVHDARVAGSCTGRSLTLPELAYFNQHFFGGAAPLHFGFQGASRSN